MRHFAHHIGDYAAATAHLSFVEDAAYHRLLRLYYRDERPLPCDVAACQRLAGARTRDERAAIETVLREFFQLGEDGWRQGRAAQEIDAYRARAEIARENGSRSGGRPKTHGKPSDNPAGFSRDTSSEPSRTLTKNQEPLTKNQSEEEGADAPRTPKEARHGKSGTRLPKGWRPSQAGRAYAAERGLDPDATADAFCDWWLAANGPTAVKRDWDAAWRTWCRRDAARPVGPRPTRPVQAARGNDAFFEQLADIAAQDRDH